MSIRNLHYLFRPRSVAVIGASNTPHTVGAAVMHNMLSSGFAGPVMPVNPRHEAVAGVLAYPDVASLPVVNIKAITATAANTSATRNMLFLSIRFPLSGLLFHVKQ